MCSHEADDVECNAPAPAQGAAQLRVDPEEEFRANAEDDAERVEFWLENSIKVFDVLSCTPKECLKFAISLLRDSAYHWWKTLVSVAPQERVILERFIGQKRKEFLEVNQGCMSVIKYERKFVRLSKYAQECVSSEAKICRRFEDILKEDIRVLVGILELKEFVMLVDQACKAEELTKEKRKAKAEAKDIRKRSIRKSLPSESKKSKEMYSRSHVLARHLYENRRKENLGFNSQVSSMARCG
ncbi:uncharacterized protein [Gossypium hirsutum]|uniref:Retrotransposon gag domain-containing protein n=1 Tax=Gossypium hirsutum TaxID=3635 RepID=A0A1U8PY99_GOSHI|nr:uncharacterized protein LOC107963280 [Gossypium hirsutum]